MQSTNIDTHPTHIPQSDTNPSTTTQGRYTTRSEGHHFRLREGSHRAVQAFRPTPHLLIQKSIRNPATIQNPIAILLQSENARPANNRTRKGTRPTLSPYQKTYFTSIQSLYQTTQTSTKDSTFPTIIQLCPTSHTSGMSSIRTHNLGRRTDRQEQNQKKIRGVTFGQTKPLQTQYSQSSPFKDKTQTTQGWYTTGLIGQHQIHLIDPRQCR